MTAKQRELLLKINAQIVKMSTPPPTTFAPQTGTLPTPPTFTGQTITPPQLPVTYQKG